MTERTSFNTRLQALLLAIAVAALGASALGGCAHEDYYCDNTGCFFCDGAGCRAATPPTRNACQGDWSCTAGQICTSAGCATTCLANSDCARGWICRGAAADGGTTRGICVAPTETSPTPTPGACTTNAQCPEGRECANGTCRPTTVVGCTADSGCTNGNVCISGRCTPPSNTCQFDNQCGAGRLCVNSECRVSCATAGCPMGQECATSGTTRFCRQIMTPTGCVMDNQCATGQICVNATCYQSCTPGSSSCGSAELYCNDQGICVADTRPRPFCDATHPCSTGSDCVGGVCRVPCTTSMQCQMVDVTYRNCGMVPMQSMTRNYCLTDSEFHPTCARQAECSMGQSCVNGSCQ